MGRTAKKAVGGKKKRWPFDHSDEKFWCLDCRAGDHDSCTSRFCLCWRTDHEEEF